MNKLPYRRTRYRRHQKCLDGMKQQRYATHLGLVSEFFGEKHTFLTYFLLTYLLKSIYPLLPFISLLFHAEYDLMSRTMDSVVNEGHSVALSAQIAKNRSLVNG
jgi:hypothetical protein